MTAPALGTTAAQADDSVRVTVKPSTIQPGGRVEVQVEGCKAQTATATSRAFTSAADLARRAFGEEYNQDQAEVARNPNYVIPLRGHVDVKPDAARGRQEISVTCDGRDHVAAGSFEVGRGSGPPAGRGEGRRTEGHRPEGQRNDHERPDHERRSDHERSEHRPTPYAPVHAGGGGTATTTAATEAAAETGGGSGPGTQHAVIGLVLAGVAAVTVAFRSVRRQRTSARDAD
ncbi:hypothetical protein DVK44_10295 [Streptomyces paludis]|uniref:Uncharacterized protein n=1 Tax=Streptomyces paludis TaxID=2282738 RepID=A0A345I0M4_9ACTN|nr:hypothetical protein DVK44_10295 [Streptomyces paludis]